MMMVALVIKINSWLNTNYFDNSNRTFSSFSISNGVLHRTPRAEQTVGILILLLPELWISRVTTVWS